MLVVDTESNGEDVRDGRGYGTGISIAARIDGSIIREYFPFRHDIGPNLPKELLEEVKRLLESGVHLTFHNAKYDIVNLRTFGIFVPIDKVYCTLLMAHLINENRPFNYELNSVAAFYLGGKNAETQKDKSDEFKKYLAEFGWAGIPAPIMRKYAQQDARLPLDIGEKIWPIFMEEGLSEYWKHKQQFIEVIIAMESRGVQIDVELCNEQARFGRNRMEEIVKELGGYTPSKSNDLQVLLLDKLGLPVYKTTPAGKPSFDKAAMELYEEDLARRDSPIAQLILEYRGWMKACSSNYEPYVRLMSPDGRLRPNYKLHGTKTGRMSCEKPNLQQIPRVSEKPWNGKMKQAFVAREGYTLWEADYGQLEFRLSAAYAKVQTLLEIFADPTRDVFTEMSLQLSMARQDTKTFVYLTQYGGGVKRAKISLGITEAKARQIRDNYFATYPGFRYMSERIGNVAKAYGKVRLWSGRYRHFFDPESEAHKAMNSVIQGGAADIVERIMVKLYHEVDVPSNDECRMLLQVHDSVIFEIKNGTEQKYHEQIHAIMENVDALSPYDEGFGVVFKVEIKKWGTKG